MQTVENEKFVGLIMEEDAPPLQGMEFVNCRFESCFTAPRSDFSTPAVLHDIRIRSCSYQACDLYTALLDDVEIDGFKHSGRHPAFTWGSRFRHVKLKGTVGSPLVRPFPDAGYTEEFEEEARVWRSELARFYSAIDWALDISEAKFTTFVTFPGVPGGCVRTNPAHQVIVERDRVLSTSFRYDMLHSLAQVVVDAVVKEDLPDLVVAAGMGGRKVQTDLAALDLLRRSGAARPD